MAHSQESAGKNKKELDKWIAPPELLSIGYKVDHC